MSGGGDPSVVEHDCMQAQIVKKHHHCTEDY